MILYMQRELLLMKKMILTIVVLLGVPLIAHHRESIGHSGREQSDPASFAHEPGSVSGESGCPAGFS